MWFQNRRMKWRQTNSKIGKSSHEKDSIDEGTDMEDDDDDEIDVVTE